METFPITNFDPEDINTYVQAIRTYEDLTGDFGRYIISKICGWGHTQSYSLHKLESDNKFDSEEFWDIFRKVSKIYPTKTMKFVEKHSRSNP